MDDSLPLQTPRLLLRPFALPDAPEIERMLGEFEVARGTLNIPHPYPPGDAARWIETRPQQWKEGIHSLAIVRRADDTLLGSVTLTVQARHDHAEVGYWIGREHWNEGYMSEALRAMLRYGFDTLGLHRVYATYFTRNPASGRVMQKVGMRHEGTLRDHYRRWEVYESVEFYGVLRSEWEG